MPLLPAEYLAHVRGGHVGLGATPPDAKPFPTTPDQDAVWRTFLGTSADQLDIANSEALSWYNTLRTTLERLDQPLLQQAASFAGIPVVWTKELDQQLLDLATMADHVVIWLREAASGRRQLAVQGDLWGLVAKDEDSFHIILDDTASPPQLVMMAGPPDHVVHMSPTGLAAGPLVVGGVAIPWVIVGLGAAGVFAVIGMVMYVLYTFIVAIRDVLIGVVQYWNQKTWSDCVQNAKSPSDCHKAIAGLTDLQKAMNESRPKSPGEDALAAAEGLDKVTKSLLWLGVGGGLLYLGLKFGVPFLEEMAAAKKARDAATEALELTAEAHP